MTTLLCESPLERLFEVDEVTGCWNWQRALERGYGEITLADGRRQRAHRFVYTRLVGPIPAGRVLHHTCENKRCVNPGHLAVVWRGEHAQLHHNGTLDAAAIVDLRERAAAGELVSDLARERGLTPKHVWKVVTGLNWPDIGGPISRPESFCGHCGAQIIGKHRHARYCSRRCKTARGRAERQAA